MRKLVFYLVLLVIVVLVAGFFLGWLDFAAQESAADDGKLALTLNVDIARIKHDSQLVVEKVREAVATIKQD